MAEKFGAARLALPASRISADAAIMTPVTKAGWIGGARRSPASFNQVARSHPSAVRTHGASADRAGDGGSDVAITVTQPANMTGRGINKWIGDPWVGAKGFTPGGSRCDVRPRVGVEGRYRTKAEPESGIQPTQSHEQARVSAISLGIAFLAALTQRNIGAVSMMR